MMTTYDDVDLGDWYTAEQAADVLSKKSGTEVKPDYVRQLAFLKKIQKVKIGARANLYKKEDIDRYTVEPRGRKSARAKKARHAKATP